MPKKRSVESTQLIKKPSSNSISRTIGLFFVRIWHAFLRYWRRGLWQKIITVCLAIFFFCTGTMYGIAQWYIASQSSKPFTLGASFVPAYAESLGLDAKETLDALIHDVGIRDFRLVSYWNQGEISQGHYDFSLLDWQFQKIEAAGGSVTLSLGLRQPRWPECHMPEWAQTQQPQTWKIHLEDYVSAVVNRYKDSPALASYQIENEYFLRGFGNCETIPGALDRSRLIDEYNLVRALDPKATIIVNRSNNALGWPIGDPQPDEFGISIYKRVWTPVLGRYIEYPFPAWYYGFVAGWTKLMTGKNTMIHELQAESWGPRGKSLADITVAEGDKSLDSTRLADRVGFAEGTGMREVYMWGAEYWYFRMIKQNDPSLWNAAKEIYDTQRPTP